MIQLREVSKSFTVHDKKNRKKKCLQAVKTLSFSVRPGEIYGLLGPNGAGKSTTLRLIAGLLRPDSGKIEICGINNQKEPEKARAQIGYLSTDINVYGRFTPTEFLRLFAEFQNIEPSIAVRRIRHMLDKFQMTELADIKMEGFSRGQKQKVSIARALLHDPKVILFDEPTSGLDVLTTKTVLDLLRIMRQDGRTVLVSTHALPRVENLCDRVGILFDGALYGDAPLQETLEAWNSDTLDDVFFKLAEREL